MGFISVGGRLSTSIVTDLEMKHNWGWNCYCAQEVFVAILSTVNICYYSLFSNILRTNLWFEVLIRGY